MSTDYAHTPSAIRHRHAKAQQVARLLYNDGLTAAQVHDMTERARLDAAHAADTRPLSTETWHLVIDLIDSMERWHQRHPNDPRGARSNPGNQHRWLPRTSPPPAHSGWDGTATEVALF